MLQPTLGKAFAQQSAFLLAFKNNSIATKQVELLHQLMSQRGLGEATGNVGLATFFLTVASTEDNVDPHKLAIAL